MSYLSINPWSGTRQAFPYQNAHDVDLALEQAQVAATGWALLSYCERGRYFHRLAEVLRKHQHKLAAMMTAEMGKRETEAVAEIIKSADACDYYAIKAEQLLADEIIQTDYEKSYVHYQPLGCVLGIMPWNFPVWQVMRFIAPTMMAGNVCLLKHAENVPQSAMLLQELINLAEFPPGTFQNLLIDNATTANLIADERCAGVSLTGSEQAGRSVAATAGKHLKKTVMELGGSDPFIVLADANLEKAITTAVKSRFLNAGQVCIAAKRFIVVDSIADTFVHRLTHACRELQCGDPAAAQTRLAPMAREDLASKLEQQVAVSVELGAQLLCGGKARPTPHGLHTLFPATILDKVAPGMPAFYQELFGPVVSIIRVANASEAIELANNSSFGLGASVWTSDEEKAIEMAEQLQAGSVFINSLVASDMRLPFGGVKQSGFGRELAGLGIREFTNAKTIVLN